MMSNKYIVSDRNGNEGWMLVGIVVCDVCKRACIMHGTKRPLLDTDRPTFLHLNLDSLNTAVRKNGDVLCWTCLDAIYRPEAKEKTSYREEPPQ